MKTIAEKNLSISRQSKLKKYHLVYLFIFYEALWLVQFQFELTTYNIIIICSYLFIGVLIRLKLNPYLREMVLLVITSNLLGYLTKLFAAIILGRFEPTIISIYMLISYLIVIGTTVFGFIITNNYLDE
jgi:hypothetical protein